MKRLLLSFLIATVMVGTFYACQYRWLINEDDEAQVMRHNVAESIYMLMGPSGRGTAFAVENEAGRKLLVTNDHVCDMAEESLMVAQDVDGRHHSVTILSKDKLHDLCILTAPRNAEPLPLAKKAVRMDDKVFIVGYPLVRYMTSTSGLALGYEPADTEIDIHPSKCKDAPKYKIRRDDDGEARCWVTLPMVLVMTAPSYHGGSGSPVLNKDGEVTGVLMAIMPGLNWTIAVPLKDLKRFINSI